MATIIPVTLVTREGVDEPGTVSGPGSVYIEDNDGNVILFVANEDGSSADVVVARTITFGGEGVGATTITLDPGDELWIGPWPPAFYNDGNSRVNIELDSGLSVFGLRF